MARYTGLDCRLCRREGMKLFLKGTKCFSEKCPFERRSYAPGQHGKTQKKLTEYGIRLREKQEAKRIYGVLERQFRRYFEEALRGKGITGEKLLQLLESRLDNVVYRLGWALSRDQAKQIVSHGKVRVNGKRVDIPSYNVKPGDIIELSDKDLIPVQEAISAFGDRSIPAWLELDRENFRGKVLRLPNREEIDTPVQEQLIVEFYSR
ncbi:MAG TPA: 30S ribosomal protein S4 [Dictyoglomaceae bacterium]|nr:30S ribosomal protein S4 [Dictyoglomaceae bacterium]HOL38812.1 30S ribosomal protein S4 [Dictyoglomaceae bacterium]HPP15440.1 30S ribosomal protein S4 [Dictyoglomaceae bacterium]